MGKATDQYRQLRDRIDGRTGLLVDIHCKHLACRPGCHDCCTDFTVSPVEYAAILEDLRGAEVSPEDLPPVERGAACAFLDDGLCGLYRFRPLICRTHGLPVAFLNEETAPSEASVSFCPKNFASTDAAELNFGPGNTLDLDVLNVELAEANLRYQQEHAGESVSIAAGTRRIPLRQLRQDLRC